MDKKLFVVIQRHEHYGNRRVFGPFNNLAEADNFAELMHDRDEDSVGAFCDSPEFTHYDILPLNELAHLTYAPFPT